MKPCAALLAASLTATPLAAQQVIEQVEVPQAVLNLFAQSGAIIDTAVAWTLDWSDRPQDELLVQLSLASPTGGNAVTLHHQFVHFEASGPVLGQEVLMPGVGLESLNLYANGVLLVVYEYLDTDARCCPSGRAQFFLEKPAQ
ncbi:hypothetical protein Q5Y75_02795 [Ruegeria sp. 2205SS24-7]|uniref:hypothetical protein n=1 Tax=Ruegeria discodermiae TaxID=3064389 RepID=UPI0027424CAC|nr:hypothetical protein [Ruegeria sp. 2205SS24-7]MDP5216133.1 hypothetical protein [Ruegeria sp. 2205SS24-7]